MNVFVSSQDRDFTVSNVFVAIIDSIACLLCRQTLATEQTCLKRFIFPFFFYLRPLVSPLDLSTCELPCGGSRMLRNMINYVFLFHGRFHDNFPFHISTLVFHHSFFSAFHIFQLFCLSRATAGKPHKPNLNLFHFIYMFVFTRWFSSICIE